MSENALMLTLLGDTLPAAFLTEAEALVARHGLTVERREWLSDENSGACVAYWLTGESADVEALRKEALALGNAQGVDVAIQPSGEWQGHRRLVCFDMDSTLIKTEVIDELARRHGVGDEVAAVTEQAMRGELDFKQSFRARMAKLEGLDEAVLADIAAHLPLMDGLETLMATLKQQGYRTAIISGGFTYFARHLQERFGFDEIHANELVIESGKVTGEVREPIVDAQRKAELLAQMAECQGLSLSQTVAVGDGANDLKMLARAGLGIAFRAKPLVREQARQSISTLGLDAVLYLLGHSRKEWRVK
ncbi:phosphoserine phosphatase SerB [Vreelandella subglaciescola]|jgi:phosphoserine phosphatase|uniref:Phosphoserine phosphatase n=1 Tax=Vreelandella subglaciescola TaxID=29571 RepID=A0A1M7FBD5_9GAMM|nr:phosphoserine phosphatase SerB [Halomonas subglaciescola]SHM01293.1 phosphoserine phosphatase [Halomonas subglaciescola]